MNPDHKKALRAISLELRHTLEGTYDERGDFQPGDLERRLNAIGVWRNRPSKPLAELTHLPDEDKAARQVIDAYLGFRAEAGVGQADAVAEFVREAAYNWANRLLTLRCMEARGIIDEVILQKEVYGRRSMVHNRLGQRDPALLAQPDEGLFTILLAEFGQRARELPTLFNPKAPAIALRPSLAALKKCLGLLSGTVKAGSYEADGDELFAAPDALGWAYQYWNAEEKDRVFEKVRTEKGAKIAGADIIPATQLYTEPYMVKFLVQNSLGALWLGMHPDSDLAEGWEYYVRDADRAPVEQKPVRDITFLDPACGSGHFHLEAFDLLYAMYEAESSEQYSVNSIQSPEEICAAILNHNLYGIDIDERAIQIAQAALWMKAKEVAWDLEPEALTGFHHHFVATNIKLPQGVNHLEAFLQKHPEDLPLRPALETVFEGLENAHELGSLLQLEEPVEKELRYLQGKQAEVAQTLQQGELFAELARPRQGALPLGVESYDAWKAKTLAQLRAHFEAEAETADLTQAFFGESAGKGLALFDILARQYDVVTANPPYMGSRNMGTELKRYIAKHYFVAKRDVYAAFILRCYGLCLDEKYVAMITLQTWLFLNSYSDLRLGDSKHYWPGLLHATRIDCLAHLGRHAFSEADPPGNPVLFVFQKLELNQNHKIFAVKMNLPREADEQANLLSLAVNDQNAIARVVNLVKQNSFLSIPDAPIVYAAGNKILSILSQDFRLNTLASAKQGLATGDNNRFVRMFWETLPTEHNRWVNYLKGGGYKKWLGFNWYSIDWQDDGARVSAFDVDTGRARIQNQDFYFRHCLTYSLMARGSMAVREAKPSIFDVGGMCIFPAESDLLSLAALFNSRITSYLLRIISQDLKFQCGTVELLPLPSGSFPNSDWHELGKTAIHLKKLTIVSNDLIDKEYYPDLPIGNEHTLGKTIYAFYNYLNGIYSVLHWLESSCDIKGFELYDLPDETIEDIIIELGRPAGWYPLLIGLDRLPSQSIQVNTNQLMFRNKSSVLPTEQIIPIKQQLKSLFEFGLVGDSDPEDIDGDSSIHEDDDNATDASSGKPIPTETFLEELSIKLQIHPISVYWLLKEGIEQEGWRCPPEEKRLTEDRFTVTVLRLLGHRWPAQIETGESVPAWVEPSGIIPISNSSPNQLTLYDRVRDRLAVDFPNGNPSSIEREFADIVGEKLSDWLAGSFFTRHISQFKKRPIAWQLQTSAAPGQRQRGGPAFAALLYYHKLSADLLPTLRNQTIRDLIRAYETEQRTLRQSQNRSSEQETRLRQLETWLTELQTFSDALQTVNDHGFGDTPALQTSLRQYALDDAMQSLKATWLRRLADKATADALPDWQTRADKTGIHPALRDWIATATANLHHHCAQVGASAPKASKLQTDPDARTLAVIIGSQAKEMVFHALHLSGDAWLRELNEHVLHPLLDEINELKTQQAALETERDALDPQDTRGHYTAEQAIKSLKSQIKNKTKERNDHRKAANELRDHIESWSCPAANDWTDWLGQQPLFDQFASLDGQRQPPQTIADFIAQESRYIPDINDGVRVNIAPLQKAGLLAADVLAAKELDKAIADRADWRADERRWCREGKLPRPGWWD